MMSAVRRRHCFLPLTVAILLGCREAPPQAPALRDGPVYQHDSAGMRFIVPERWQQTANSTLPAGSIDKEVLLARYRIPTTAAGASLEILCQDAVDVNQVLAYHQQPSYAIADWSVVEPPSSIEIQGVRGTHMLLRGQLNDTHLAKEVVVFDRDNRRFHFVGLFSPDDPDARQQIRRAVHSVAWREVSPFAADTGVPTAALAGQTGW